MSLLPQPEPEGSDNNLIQSNSVKIDNRSPNISFLIKIFIKADAIILET
jgi:hypothetical protein